MSSLARLSPWVWSHRSLDTNKLASGSQCFVEPEAFDKSALHTELGYLAMLEPVSSPLPSWFSALRSDFSLGKSKLGTAIHHYD